MKRQRSPASFACTSSKKKSSPHEIASRHWREELTNVLRKYGYTLTRQTGSHMRLTSSFKGTEHHITIPRHKQMKIGTLSDILKEVASYLEIDKQTLLEELFK